MTWGYKLKLKRRKPTVIIQLPLSLELLKAIPRAPLTTGAKLTLKKKKNVVKR